VAGYDITLKLRFPARSDVSENDIVAYVADNEDARNIACYILSYIMATNVPASGARIVLVDESRLTEDDELYILKYGKYNNIIYLELGNIMAPKLENLNDAKSVISNAIEMAFHEIERYKYAEADVDENNNEEDD
jgi:hypothetical protein